MLRGACLTKRGLVLHGATLFFGSGRGGNDRGGNPAMYLNDTYAVSIALIEDGEDFKRKEEESQNRYVSPLLMHPKTSSKMRSIADRINLSLIGETIFQTGNPFLITSSTIFTTLQSGLSPRSMKSVFSLTSLSFSSRDMVVALNETRVNLES